MLRIFIFDEVKICPAKYDGQAMKHIYFFWETIL